MGRCSSRSILFSTKRSICTITGGISEKDLKIRVGIGMVKDEEAVPVEDPEPGLSLFPVGGKNSELLGVPHLFGDPRLTRDVKPRSMRLRVKTGSEAYPRRRS